MEQSKYYLIAYAHCWDSNTYKIATFNGATLTHKNWVNRRIDELFNKHKAYKVTAVRVGTPMYYRIVELKKQEFNILAVS